MSNTTLFCNYSRQILKDSNAVQLLWQSRQVRISSSDGGVTVLVKALPPLVAGGGKSSKGNGRSNGRKAKSPGPGLSGGERPSSVSSVHSEGDCNRRTPLTNRVWEDRPSSTGRNPSD